SCLFFYVLPFLFYYYAYHPSLLSFPTRRSSDLSRTGTAATTGPSRPAEAPPVPPAVSGRCPPAPEPRRRYYKPRAAGPPPASAARAHAEVGGRAAAGVPGTVVGAGGVGGFGTSRLGAAPEAAGSSRALLLVGG